VTEAQATLEQAARSRVLSGILLMCLGVSMFPFLNTAAKLLTDDYPIVEIVWARFTGHLICVLIAFMPQRGWRIFAARRPMVQISRSFLLLASTTLFVSAIGHLPLATASAIGFTSPFIVTALSSRSVPGAGRRSPSASSAPSSSSARTPRPIAGPPSSCSPRHAATGSTR